MTLTNFLLARIAEDETAADLVSDRRCAAECAAKREIVTDYRRWDLVSKGGDMAAAGTAIGLRVACLRLVAVYKDHPDFDEVWLP